MEKPLHEIFGEARKRNYRQTIDLLCEGDERELHLLEDWTIHDYFFNVNEMVVRPPNKRKSVERGRPKDNTGVRGRPKRS